MKFFENVRTLDELKAEYRRLAMKHHPDRGGDVETMKAINAEHDVPRKEKTKPKPGAAGSIWKGGAAA